MTDAASGSATAERPDAGIPGGANGTDGANPGSQGATSPQGDGAADPFAGLQDAGIREWIGKAGLKDVQSLAVKARDAERLIGSSIRLPGDDAKPEEWDKVYARLGRPDKPDGYEFKPPADMPEGLPYNQDFASWFKGAAHAEGLSKKAAAGLHDKFVEMSVKQAVADYEARITAAEAALAKAWGGPKDSEAYKAKVELADRGIKALGGDDLMTELKATGLLGSGGEILSPAIAQAFAKAGEALGKEGGLVTGATSDGPNPFANGSQNMTEQMVVIKQDRAKARRLIQAAGRDPAEWGIT